MNWVLLNYLEILVIVFYCSEEKGRGLQCAQHNRPRQQHAHFTDEENEALKSHLSCPGLAPSLWQRSKLHSICY